MSPRAASWRYRLYGQHVACDGPLPGLAPVTDDAEPTLRVFLAHPERMPGRLPAAERPWYAAHDDQGRLYLSIHASDDPPRLRLAYTDGSEFFVERNGRAIWVPNGRHPAEDWLPYLLGPLLGLALRLQGVLCLHASAVALAGRAILFAGDTYAGKSTTARLLGARGCAVLSDDIVPLTQAGEEVLAQPGYPRLRIRARGEAPGPDGPRRHYLDLADDAIAFQSAALPVGVIYLLSWSEEAGETPDIVPLTGRAALMGLVANSYAGRILSSAQRAQELRLMEALLGQVPLRRVVSRAGVTSAQDRCAALLADADRQVARRPEPAGPLRKAPPHG